MHDLLRILTHERGSERMFDAIADKPIGRQVGVRARKAVAAQTNVGMHDHSDRTPMRHLMHTVGDLLVRNGDVQNEWFEGGDFHDADGPGF
jgi:hypothetical protein